MYARAEILPVQIGLEAIAFSSSLLLTQELPSARLLLGSTERCSDERSRTSQLDTDDPLQLAQKLLIWYSTTSLDVRNLTIS
jgi:hypothetical protein